MDDINDYLDPKKYKQRLLRAYKNIFSKTIKETFLISMLERIENDPRYQAILLTTFNPDELLSIESHIFGKNVTNVNLCKMIIMSHYVNTVTLNDFERGKQQNSNQYKEKLTTDVINMFKVERLATADYGNSSLESFLPLIYYVSSVTNFIGNKYEELKEKQATVNSNYNNDFNWLMIYKIIMKIKACVNLVDLRAVDELVVIFRSLIETFMTYAALWDGSDGVINSFYEFDQIAFKNNFDEEIPERFKLLAKDMGVNETRFINYGWIKNLDEFKSLSNKAKAISLSGLGKILDKKCNYFCRNFGTDLHKIYKACNPQTHGTALTMNYFELELHVFQNIATMLKFLCEIMSKQLFSFEIVFGNTDLLDLLNTSLNDSRVIYDWLHSDSKNLLKTNIDYRDRAICSMRMKK